MLRYSLTLSLLLWTTTLFAAVVGKIEDLACPSDYYSLIRQNQAEPVKIFMELQNGDQLALNPNKSLLSDAEPAIGPCREKVTPETVILSLGLNGKPDKAVKYAELPYSIPDGLALPTTTDNFIAQFSSWFTKQHDEQLDKQLKVLVSKTSDIQKPLVAILKDERQQLVAGERELFITWQFGKPPFTVTIKGNGQSQVFSDLPERQLQQLLKLTPGQYHFLLKDALQQTVDYDFKVVDSQPAFHFSKKLQDLTEESSRLIAQILCLAIYEKGIWRLEAVQRLHSHVKNDAPTRILSEALLQGAEMSPLDLIASDCEN